MKKHFLLGRAFGFTYMMRHSIFHLSRLSSRPARVFRDDRISLSPSLRAMTDPNNHFQGTEKASVAYPSEATPTLARSSFDALTPTQVACSEGEGARASTSASPRSRQSRGAAPVRAPLLRTPGLAPPTCPPRRPHRAYKKQQPCPLVRAD